MSNSPEVHVKARSEGSWGSMAPGYSLLDNCGNSHLEVNIPTYTQECEWSCQSQE